MQTSPTHRHSAVTSETESMDRTDVPLLPRDNHLARTSIQADGETDALVARDGRAATADPNNMTNIRKARRQWQHVSVPLALPAPAIVVVLVLLVAVVIYWTALAVSFSSESSPTYALFSRKLSQGWFNRKMDNSDAQFRSFRNNIPILTAVMIGHQILSIGAGIRFATSAHYGYIRMCFSLVFSLIFLAVLFGIGLVKILLVCGLHYMVVKRIGPTWHSLMFSWVVGLCILFGTSLIEDLSFGSMNSSLAWMDSMKGIGMSPSYNFTILRMVSFSADSFWKSTDSSKQFEKHKLDCTVCLCGNIAGVRCASGRIIAPHNETQYSFINYLAYLLYAPLFLAGPIICFNDFVAQVHHPPKEVTPKRIAVAVLRWLALVVLMEVFIHYMYVVAIKDTEAWVGFTSVEIYTLGYWNLNHIWLKLTIIWRFFGLWALADGIETVDNMAKCMSNHYSGIGFWRAWHKSFNRWLVRYLYVPLGGNKRYLLNLIVTFTFVAIWHDVKLRLLAWGWLIALFILPEMVFTKLFCTDKWRTMLGPLHLHLCALGGVCNIFTMMLANLVGFAVGIKGMQEFVSQIMNGKGIKVPSTASS
ncbi:hypothetical protein BSLG_005053 [Batrachochytrium salamandrivorans]|nr:hypothetical protein BSLG_005053 [Batrachochytrium salamandrivorans]